MNKVAISVAIRLALAAALAVAPAGVVCAQSPSPTPVRFDPVSRMFRMDSAQSSYLIGINEKSEVQTLYWGDRLSLRQSFPSVKQEAGSSSFDPPSNVTPREYVGWGGMMYVEPDLKVSFPDGNRDLVLNYVSHKIDGAHLSIRMKDIAREVYVVLNYDLDQETGILARSAIVENNTKQPIFIEQVAAATWNIPAGDDYRLRYLSGRWAAEWSLNEQKIGPGKIVLESRRGTTGSQNNPWFAIDHSQVGPNMESGEVWFGALAWSGSWQIAVEQDTNRKVRVTGGPNAFDFRYCLPPNGRFESPVFYGGYSNHGVGGASRLLHRFELRSLLPKHPKEKPRPVLYNSWEATGFSVNEKNQEALAEKAAGIGAERFVMDDGWFGARNSDQAGLGDWVPNKTKFPNGLTPLINKVHSLGMDFGLWVEPEMVNPDSDLFRQHPDWALQFKGRPQTLGRNQMVLNLARPDVRDYIFNVLDRLLSENDIAFLKWDYNRNWSEPGWDSVPLDQQKNVYVDFTRNFYQILAKLRSKHPDVEIESCSGGGSRVDLGVLKYVDQVWPSDNTDAFDRLKIQNGFSYAYAPAVMMSWVTDSPNWVNARTVSMEYRFLSSMQGSLGIGGDLSKWSASDLATAQRMVAAYKRMRTTIQRGDLYRIEEPTGGSERSVTESVALDGSQAVVFAFLHSSSEGYPYPAIHLQGLEPDAFYKVEAFAGSLDPQMPPRVTGSYLKTIGLKLNLKGDFVAAGISLTREPD